MLQFNSLQTKELKNFIHKSNIHDAKVKDIRYDRQNKRLVIETINLTQNTGFKFTFVEPRLILSISGNWQGSYETILSLTVEEDSSYLENNVLIYDNKLNESLYLLFQMFSGDELHIVSAEVLIDNIGG